MKKLQHRVLSLIVIGLIAIPTVVLADFKSEIIASCSSYQQGQGKNEINACKLYIDGFIDSSLLTEDAVIQPKSLINNKPKEQSAYLQRAYQTRVNDLSFRRDHQDYQFCIPREYTRKAVASDIAKSMDIQQLTQKPLKEVLFETLITDFPCQ